MYGLRNSELSTCLFQFSHRVRQTMLLYAYFTPKVANLTITNRFFTNDDWQRGRFEIGRFENFESDHQYESNLELDVRFEIESNHEALQVPILNIPLWSLTYLCQHTNLLFYVFDIFATCCSSTTTTNSGIRCGRTAQENTVLFVVSVQISYSQKVLYLLSATRPQIFLPLCTL